MTGLVLLVVTKAPVAGRVKTRLCPPASYRQAARIAAAALLDTLDAARAASDRVVVAMAGELAEAERAGELRTAMAGTTVLTQHGRTFADRIANAHADTAHLHPGTAVLQVGADTPQLTGELFAEATAVLRRPGVDAVLGPAADGGWWALGLHDPLDATALRSVPMSTPDTGEQTMAALRRHGLRVTALGELSDVDTWTDAEKVAADCPATRFGVAVTRDASTRNSHPQR